MTWVRLADDFTDHPKVVRAGPLAGWLYVCGLTYANRYATDGLIPGGQVSRLAAVPDPERLARRLVEAGLWEEVEDGFVIHDYGAYQPSSDEIKRERADAARRQAEYRKRRAEARDAARNGETHTDGDALLTRESQPSRATGAPWTGPARPGPVNTSVPDVSSSPQPPPPQAEEGERNPGRRSRGVVRGEDDAAPPPEVATSGQSAVGSGQSGLAPLTVADRALWMLALGKLPEMSAGNREQVGLLEPLGRAPDGGLRLRAPPGLPAKRFAKHVARALGDAGDQAAEHVAIVEG